MKNKKSNISIRYYSSVNTSEVSWLWYPYIPYGKLTLIQGDPGDGKSSLALKIASILSVGGRMPDGSKISEPVNIIYQCLEDDTSDTIKPRLENYGADTSKIAFLSDNISPVASFDDDTLLNAIQKMNAKLLILDPIQSFFNKDFDYRNVGMVRVYLNKLAVIGAKTGCAIILIGHLNKNESGKNIYRGLGSIDIPAISRSILQVGRLREDSKVRIIRHVKSSLAPEGGTFGFEIDDINGISWIGDIDLENESEDIIGQSTCCYGEKTNTVKNLLVEWLESEDLPYNEIIVRMNKYNVSLRTIKMVKKELGICSIRKSDGWYWHLPDLELSEGNE